MTLGRRNANLLLYTALSLVCTVATSSAQSTNETQLETIVVKGKRVVPASAASDTPLATQTTADEISQKQITSISDLGRTAEVGVNFNRSTGAVNIRGLEGARVLTTVDGIPLAYLADEARSVRGGVDTINFYSLSAVDVVRGADSSRGGAGAMGGVLAFRTVEVEDLLSVGKNWGAVGKVDYDSADSSIGGSIAVGQKIANTSVLFQAGYRKGHERKNSGTVGGFGDKRTVQDPADTHKYDLLFKLRHEFDGPHSVNFVFERVDQSKDIDARALQGTADYDPGQYQSFEEGARNRVSLGYNYDSIGNDSLVDQYEAKLYWQHQEIASGYNGIRISAPIGSIGRKNANEQETIGLIGHGEKELTISGNRHDVSFGHDLSYLKTEQYSSGYDNCVPPYGFMSSCSFLHTNQADAPEVSGYKLGLFIEDKISLGETGLSLTPGVRFDWLEYTPKMTDAFGRNFNKPKLPGGFSDLAISPKLRAEFDISDQVTVYGQWARAFRAPTMSELYSVFGGSGTYLRLGNPDLKSETGNSFDVGVDIKESDYLLKASAFFNSYENSIDTRLLPAGIERNEALAKWGISGGVYPLGVTQQYNVPHAQIWGAEFSATKSFDNGLSFSAGFAYANGKDRDSGEFLRSVAPMKLALGANYDTETWGVGANWIGVREAKGASTSGYFKTPGYGIVDLNAWYEPEQFKGMRIQAAINNLFDKTYYDYSSVRSKGTPYERHSEPGRTFKISLTQKF